MLRVKTVTFRDPAGHTIRFKLELNVKGLTRDESDEAMRQAIRALPPAAMFIPWTDFGVDSMVIEP